MLICVLLALIIRWSNTSGVHMAALATNELGYKFCITNCAFLSVNPSNWINHFVQSKLVDCIEVHFISKWVMHVGEIIWSLVCSIVDSVLGRFSLSMITCVLHNWCMNFDTIIWIIGSFSMEKVNVDRSVSTDNIIVDTYRVMLQIFGPVLTVSEQICSNMSI